MDSELAVKQAQNEFDYAEKMVNKQEKHIEGIKYQLSQAEETLKGLKETEAEKAEKLKKAVEEYGEKKETNSFLETSLTNVGPQGIWMRPIVELMKNAPGQQFHYNSNLFFHLIKLGVPVTTPKGDQLSDNKSRAAILNFLKNLIARGYVTQCKNGHYSWGEPTKGKVSPFTHVPSETASNVVPISGNGTSSPTMSREFYLKRLFEEVCKTKEDYLQKTLEGRYHVALINAGLSSDTDHKANAQELEQYFYSRAQPNCVLKVWHKKVRQGAEVSEIVIRSADKAHMDPTLWQYEMYPTTKQPSVPTRRPARS